MTKAEATKYSGEHVMLPRDQLGGEEKRAAKSAMAKAHAKAERSQATRKRLKSVFQRKAMPLCGMTIHLCDQLHEATKTQCRTAIQQHRMKECTNPTDAVYFVCGNPAQPRQRVQLVVTMCGGMLVTPEWLTTGGKLGLALSAVPAVQAANRRLWVSDSFAMSHPEGTVIIQQALLAPDSRWRSCSKDIYVAAALKNKPPWGTIALVTTAEKKRAQCSHRI